MHHIMAKMGCLTERNVTVLDTLEDLEIQVEPVTEKQARVARRAFQEFGKGAHPAGLSFGDCVMYALAKVPREPLLFKGNDFTKTDLESAVKPLQ